MKYSKETELKIKQGRSKFVAMSSTYFMGVFNDNFFKQAGLLLAIAASKSYLQGVATILFSLPFILFSAHTGWIADRFSKGRVVVISKLIELLAMVVGSYAILTLNFPLIMGIIFTMALQSTLFSPALNGSIPELFPDEYVTEANAILKLVTTIAILMGIALAGLSLDIDLSFIKTAVPSGRWIVVIIMTVVALAGFIASFGVYKHKPEKGVAKFPWFGPINSMVDLYKKRSDGPLMLALSGSAYFYFISSLAILIINEFCASQLGFSNTITSLFIATLMIGVCVGSFIAAKISNSKNWTGLVVPSSLGLALGIFAIAGTSLFAGSFQKIYLLLTLIFTGTLGGILLIPIASFIQVRPAPNEKGKVIGVGNFLDFSGIMVSGLIYYVMNGQFRLLPSNSLIITGMVGLLISFILFILTRKEKYHV